MLARGFAKDRDDLGFGHSCFDSVEIRLKRMLVQPVADRDTYEKGGTEYPRGGQYLQKKDHGLHHGYSLIESGVVAR